MPVRWYFLKLVEIEVFVSPGTNPADINPFGLTFTVLNTGTGVNALFAPSNYNAMLTADVVLELTYPSFNPPMVVVSAGSICAACAVGYANTPSARRNFFSGSLIADVIDGTIPAVAVLVEVA